MAVRASQQRAARLAAARARAAGESSRARRGRRRWPSHGRPAPAPGRLAVMTTVPAELDAGAGMSEDYYADAFEVLP